MSSSTKWEVSKTRTCQSTVPVFLPVLFSNFFSLLTYGTYPLAAEAHAVELCRVIVIVAVIMRGSLGVAIKVPLGVSVPSRNVYVRVAFRGKDTDSRLTHELGQHMINEKRLASLAHIDVSVPRCNFISSLRGAAYSGTVTKVTSLAYKNQNIIFQAAHLLQRSSSNCSYRPHRCKSLERSLYSLRGVDSL